VVAWEIFWICLTF